MMDIVKSKAFLEPLGLPEGTELIRLPHLAFSGRIFLQEIPDLMNFAP